MTQFPSKPTHPPIRKYPHSCYVGRHSNVIAECEEMGAPMLFLFSFFLGEEKENYSLNWKRANWITNNNWYYSTLIKSQKVNNNKNKRIQYYKGNGSPIQFEWFTAWLLLLLIGWRASIQNSSTEQTAREKERELSRDSWWGGWYWNFTAHRETEMTLG